MQVRLWRCGLSRHPDRHGCRGSLSSPSRTSLAVGFPWWGTLWFTMKRKRNAHRHALDDLVEPSAPGTSSDECPFPTHRTQLGTVALLRLRTRPPQSRTPSPPPSFPERAARKRRVRHFELQYESADNTGTASGVPDAGGADEEGGSGDSHGAGADRQGEEGIDHGRGADDEGGGGDDDDGFADDGGGCGREDGGSGDVDNIEQSGALPAGSTAPRPQDGQSKESRIGRRALSFAAARLPSRRRRSVRAMTRAPDDPAATLGERKSMAHAERQAAFSCVAMACLRAAAGLMTAAADFNTDGVSGRLVGAPQCRSRVLFFRAGPALLDVVALWMSRHGKVLCTCRGHTQNTALDSVTGRGSTCWHADCIRDCLTDLTSYMDSIRSSITVTPDTERHSFSFDLEGTRCAVAYDGLIYSPVVATERRFIRCVAFGCRSVERSCVHAKLTSVA